MAYCHRPHLGRGPYDAIPSIHRRFIADSSRPGSMDAAATGRLGRERLVTREKAGNLAHRRREAATRREGSMAMASSLDTDQRYPDASGFPRVSFANYARVY